MLTLAAADSDDAAGRLTFALAGASAHGSLSGFNPATGAVTYTPNPGNSGVAAFGHTAGDDEATSAPATVSITVGRPV